MPAAWQAPCGLSRSGLARASGSKKADSRALLALTSPVSERHQ
ncbi:hypothetical protein SZ55_2885 [Pseudomonas sp. FeS53a]|nr:hypothetical protein SZ55_2885 [Pseudomonas sp. FeS53a]